MDYDEDDLLENDEEAPFWTPRRIIFTVIIIITLVAFLAYVFLSSWYYTTSRPTQSFQQG